APVAPGVAVVRGPIPRGGVPVAPPPGRFPFGLLALLAGGMVATMAAAGSGWAAALLSRGVRLALSPALGVAALVITGTVADRAGIRLHGSAAVAVAVLPTVAGWVVAGAVRHRPRVGDPGEGQ